MLTTLGRTIRIGLTLSLALTSLVAVSGPSRAGNGVVEIMNSTAGIIDSLGKVVNPPKAAAPSPPPQTQYVPVYVHSPRSAPRPAPRHCQYERRVDFDGVDYVHSKLKVCQAPPPAPRHCWYEGRSAFDGQDYVHHKVKVCR